MIPTLHVDFETRSELDLKEVGLHRYARHPSTDVWCMAWSLGDADPALITLNGAEHCGFIPHVKAGLPVYAHNAPFELDIWNNIMVPRYGWPELKPEQTFCTMAMCYAMGLPGKLEDAALAMGLNFLKDHEGHALMLRMCRPRSKAGQPVVWWDDADKLNRLYEYCKQDVRVERELHKRLMPLPDRERKVWLLDYKINQRGVQLDMDTVNAAIKMVEIVKENCNAELTALTNGNVLSVTALAALKEWLNERGVKCDSLAKQAVTDILAGDDLPEDARRALTLRQEVGKASTAKFNVMQRQVGADGRLRNMYQYHGAATGRWAGRGVQTHNLPRDMPKPAAVERILSLVREGSHVALDAIYGAPISTMSRCIRSFFVAPPGKQIVSGDFANVEGRGQAWFAGEDWKIKAFIAADNKQGPGIYELAYAKSFNVPVESVKNPSEERQVGKVMELAFGYQGGVGSFRVMAKTYGVKVSDTKANEFKEAWRTAHPNIKQVWYDIQRAAISAVKQPGTAFACGHPARQAKYKMVGSFLWCLLPSGRAICYPYPKLLESEYGPQLTYMTVPGPDKDAIIHDPKNTSGWARVGTYGGSLFNNIVQGFSRDLLADVMLRVDQLGAPIVLHTHDDLNVEVPNATAEAGRAAVEKIMRSPPAWAAGFPLTAECKLMTRYGK